MMSQKNHTTLQQLIFLCLFCFTIHTFAQVGINTTTPDASSILDLSATDKGLLIPRISISTTSTTMLDGTNTAATGLLVYNTNASITGGNGVGFYIFNGTTWDKVTTTADNITNNAFFEVGTTTPPDDIADDIFTQGNVGIGETSPTSKLEITDATTSQSSGYVSTKKILSRTIDNASSTETIGQINSVAVTSPGIVGGIFPGALGTQNIVRGTNMYFLYGTENDVSTSNSTRQTYGTYNKITGSTSTIAQVAYGTYNSVDLSSGDGRTYGTRNQIHQTSSTGEKIGVFNVVGNNDTSNTAVIKGIQNNIGDGAGTQYGTYNFFNNTGTGEKYGTYTLFPNNGGNQVSGTLYGSRVDFDASVQGTYPKHGFHVDIPDSNLGTHYGLYSDVLKADSYAGYFLGRVSIGTTTSDNYILPTSRGTNTQILQTDGSGNVSWQSLSSYTSYWTRSGTELDVATAADDISFSSDQTSIIFPATSGTPSSMIYMFDNGSFNSNRMVLSHSPTFANWGLEYDDSDDSFIFKSNTIDRVEIDLTGTYPLIVNGTTRSTAFESDTATYPDYVFEQYYNGNSALNPNYNFKTLEQVEAFIKTYGHLPGVKSYKEVKANGMTLNLAETSVANLEKIEELFLYTIQLQKENKALKQKLEDQDERLKRIEALLAPKD